MWYRRSFTVPSDMQGRVGFSCAGAWILKPGVRKRPDGGHPPGRLYPFGFDITALVREGENDLCLRVEDQPDCGWSSRQAVLGGRPDGLLVHPLRQRHRQTVWLEAAGDNSLTAIHVTPDIDRCRVRMCACALKSAPRPAHAPPMS